MNTINGFILFMIFFFIILISNNLFIKAREGLDNKAPSGDPQPYPEGADPPPSPPTFKQTQSTKPPPKGDGLGGAPPYCGCIDSKTHSLYNKNTSLLSELKKNISNLVDTVKKSRTPVKSNVLNIAQSKNDDFKMCCTSGPAKREDDGEGDVIRPSGFCYMMNKYKCPDPPKKGEESDDEDENLPSSHPTPEQIKNG